MAIVSICQLWHTILLTYRWLVLVGWQMDSAPICMLVWNSYLIEKTERSDWIGAIFSNLKSELDLAFVDFIVARYKIAPTIPNVKRNPKTLPTLKKLGEKINVKNSKYARPNWLPTSFIQQQNRDFVFSRYFNEKFPWRKYSIKALVS